MFVFLCEKFVARVCHQATDTDDLKLFTENVVFSVDVSTDTEGLLSRPRVCDQQVDTFGLMLTCSKPPIPTIF